MGTCTIKFFTDFIFFCHCERGYQPTAAIQGAVNVHPTFLWIATPDKQPRDDKGNFLVKLLTENKL